MSSSSRVRRRYWSRSALVFSLFACLGQSAPPESAENLPLDWDTLERKIEEMRRQEHSLERVLLRDGSEMAQLRARIIARGRAYYRIARSSPQTDFFERAVRIERLRQGLLADVKKLRALQQGEKGLSHQLGLLKERRVPLELERKAAGQAQAALLSQQERERAFELAFSSSRVSSDHTAVYGAAELAPGGRFLALRGRLPFPLPGRTEVIPVKKPFARGPGLVFRAASGTPVRSVADGRVAYASEYAEYGRTVILDHGDEFFTVSSGLAQIEVQVGDELPAGTRLGLIGGASKLGELYFEVRQNLATVPPGEWFGI